MKKLLLMALLLPGIAACKKKDKENIVRYRIDGVERAVTGAYSQINFKGIDYGIQNKRLGIGAHYTTEESLIIRGLSVNQTLGEYTKFDSAIFNTNTARMSLDLHQADGSSIVYYSFGNESGGYKFTINDAQNISGSFDGMLYTYGKTDSIFISDGYFYLNK